MKKIISGMIIIATTLFIGCDENSTQAVNAETGTIMGTITFTGENCPTSDLTIGIYSNWNAQGPPAAYISVMADDISNDSYNYTISDVVFGTYAATFVAWEDINTVNENSAQTQKYTLGLHGSSYDVDTGMFSTPTSITLSPTSYEVENVNITAYCSAMPN